MSQQLSTKALPQYDWGQEWVKPNGELSCIVIIYEDLDEPDFSDKTLSDGVIVFRNITTTITEKSFHERYPTVINKWINRCPNHLMMITTHHEPDTTPRELRFGQNYSRMYISGAFNGGIGSFENDTNGETVMTYKDVHLDDSILDIDSWLPENAIDNIVQLIMQQEEETTMSKSNITLPINADLDI